MLPRRLGLLVWGVHDLSVTQCCLVWSAAEADRVCSCLLQSYGANNHHLRERHGNRYRPGELARMSKDCFYAGLLPEIHPMVVHLKDQPHTTPLDLLKALVEQEENDTLTRTWYPPSTLSRMSQLSKPAERYHRQPPADKRNDGYTVRPAQLDADSTKVAPEVNSTPLNDTLDALETWYNDGFLIGLCQAAEVSKLQHGRCFNCQKEGHHLHQFKEPLSPELQEVSD